MCIKNKIAPTRLIVAKSCCKVVLQSRVAKSCCKVVLQSRVAVCSWIDFPSLDAEIHLKFGSYGRMRERLPYQDLLLLTE